MRSQPSVDQSSPDSGRECMGHVVVKIAVSVFRRYLPLRRVFATKPPENVQFLDSTF